MAALVGAPVAVFKVLGDFAVIIKAVHNMKMLGKGGTLDGKIGGTAAAED